MTTRRQTAAVIASVLLLTACGDDFEPRTLIDGYRVMGVGADKPEIAPDETVHLTAYDANTDGADYIWSLCLLSFGGELGFACADPSLEFPLDGSGREIDLDLSAFGPDDLDLRALYDTYGPFPNPSGAPTTLDDGFEIYVRLVSGPSDGRVIESVKRLLVRESGDAPNANPVIERFTVDREAEGATGTAGSEVKLEVVIADDAEQPYVDPYTGRDTAEELLFTWYTTGGEFDPGLTFGDDRDTTLELPDEPGEIDVWVTVRDGRGGLSVAHTTVDVASP